MAQFGYMGVIRSLISPGMILQVSWESKGTPPYATPSQKIRPYFLGGVAYGGVPLDSHESRAFSLEVQPTKQSLPDLYGSTLDSLILRGRPWQ